MAASKTNSAGFTSIDPEELKAELVAKYPTKVAASGQSR